MALVHDTAIRNSLADLVVDAIDAGAGAMVALNFKHQRMFKYQPWRLQHRLLVMQPTVQQRQTPLSLTRTLQAV